MIDINFLIMDMIKYFTGDPKRIQHFLKVYEFAILIAKNEALPSEEYETLAIAALTHDIGIKNSEQRHGNASGKNQEIEGPPEAERMLSNVGYPKEVIERVCYLIAHHHTYDNIDQLDYQILIEADFLVNIYEDELPKSAVKSVYQNIFKTETGKYLCQVLYDLEP